MSDLTGENGVIEDDKLEGTELSNSNILNLGGESGGDLSGVIEVTLTNNEGTLSFVEGNDPTPQTQTIKFTVNAKVKIASVTGNWYSIGIKIFRIITGNKLSNLNSAGSDAFSCMYVTGTKLTSGQTYQLTMTNVELGEIQTSDNYVIMIYFSQTANSNSPDKKCNKCIRVLGSQLQNSGAWTSNNIVSSDLYDNWTYGHETGVEGGNDNL